MSSPRKLLDAYAASEALDDDHTHPTHEDLSPQAIAALRAVLDLHIRIPSLEGSGTAFCLTCWLPGEERMEPAPWPCRTVEVVITALESP